MFNAIEEFDVHELKRILEENPELDINWKNDQDFSVLHLAATRGHDEIVKILLAQPLINVNILQAKKLDISVFGLP